MYFLWREALPQDIWNWFLGEARGGLLHSYMRCTCERPTNHLNKSEHKKGHGLMHWGAHVEGSDACWHFHTSAEPPLVQHVPSATSDTNETASACSRSLPGLRALGTSPGVLQVWGSQTAWLVCSKLLNFVPEPSDSAWEDFGGAMWPREATTIHQ